MVYALFFAVLAVLLSVVVGYRQYKNEARIWNGGIAPSGNKWVLSKTNADGRREYTDGGTHTCLIGYADLKKTK